MIFEVRGKLLKKYDTVNVSKNPQTPFNKREFVLEITETSKVGTFTETCLFELTKDKCSKLDSFNEGDPILVKFGLKGRAWENQQGETKYFNNLSAWDLVHVEAQENVVTNANDISMDIPVDDDEESDLPF